MYREAIYRFPFLFYIKAEMLKKTLTLKFNIFI